MWVEPVLADLDMVLLMTVHPGFTGQKFIDAVVPKIRALRARSTGAASTSTSRSIGASTATVASVVEAGANVLVAGVRRVSRAEPRLRGGDQDAARGGGA